jgi:cell division transport system permease protein
MNIFATFWQRQSFTKGGGESAVELPALAQDKAADHGEAVSRDQPLVPASSIAGRALTTVIAIMTFLASITAGTAVLIAEASHAWQGQVAQEISIQIPPTPGRDLDADAERAAEIARRTEGIGHVHAYSKGEAEDLLKPWLGSGADLSDLPIPRLIVAGLDKSRWLDVKALEKKLSEKVPQASVDDHRLWLERLSVMANSVVGASVIILLLVLTAMGLAVAFATQGAMAGNREIIEVLHFAGAADHYICWQFQRHFFGLGLRGGAIGGGLAILIFLLAGMVLSWLGDTPGGEQMEVMFGSFSLDMKGYLIILSIGAVIAVLTSLVSRIIVFRHLQDLS